MKIFAISHDASCNINSIIQQRIRDIIQRCNLSHKMTSYHMEYNEIIEHHVIEHDIVPSKIDFYAQQIPEQ